MGSLHRSRRYNRECNSSRGRSRIKQEAAYWLRFRGVFVIVRFVDCHAMVHRSVVICPGDELKHTRANAASDNTGFPIAHFSFSADGASGFQSVQMAEHMSRLFCIDTIIMGLATVLARNNSIILFGLHDTFRAAANGCRSRAGRPGTHATHSIPGKNLQFVFARRARGHVSLHFISRGFFSLHFISREPPRRARDLQSI
jgi:hypothetical protein